MPEKARLLAFRTVILGQRRESAQYALTVFEGVMREVYIIEKWHRARSCRPPSPAREARVRVVRRRVAHCACVRRVHGLPHDHSALLWYSLAVRPPPRGQAIRTYFDFRTVLRRYFNSVWHTGFGCEFSLGFSQFSFRLASRRRERSLTRRPFRCVSRAGNIFPSNARHRPRVPRHASRASIVLAGNLPFH